MQRVEVSLEVLEGERRKAADLRSIVPTAQTHRIGKKWKPFEISHLGRRHRAPLEREARQRRRGEPREIGLLHGAKVSLCRHVKPDRRHHGRGELRGKPVGAGPLMEVIDAAIGSVIGKVVEEMAANLNFRAVYELEVYLLLVHLDRSS